jgi:hypothetical protein
MKIFISAYDVIGSNMAGPGIRSLAIAEGLCKDFDITLSIDENSQPDCINKSVKVIHESVVEWDSCEYFKQFDTAILPGSQRLKTNLPSPFPIPLVVDIYDPFVLENLELLADKPKSIRDYEYSRHLKALLEMILSGDRFLVTSDRTADFFNGMMTAWGVINPISSKELLPEEMIINLPFGIPDDPIEQFSSDLPSDLVSRISQKDKLILWAGGLWDWLDPMSLVESMPQILDTYLDAMLLFTGYKHPNPHVPIMKMATDCIDKAKKIKLFDNRIIFREWTPYVERIPILKRTSLGVSLHKRHLETKYSFRTRLMDYIWGSIPMVLSEGDYLSGKLIDMNVAEPVSMSDKNSVANAVIKMLGKMENPEARIFMNDTFKTLQSEYTWSNLLKPLTSELKRIRKVQDDEYRANFRHLLESFPIPPQPGIIDKAIAKIKKGLR